MIERYTRKEMGALWAEGRRFHYMLKVEQAAAKAQAKYKMIPNAAAIAISKKGKFQINRILELEKITRHDVIAFVSNVSENVGPHGRFVHYGLTSSDVIDTALSLQIQESMPLVLKAVDELLQSLKKLSLAQSATLTAGRTHGMHAEITSFGYKMSGYVAELVRHRKRLKESLEQCLIGKLSGAVGTYSSLPQKVEDEVCRLLKLQPEQVATQVIPRDRHAQLFTSFGLLAGFFERLAVELRHLQRTELSEAIEGFKKGQKGSSAMPHKKNPISAENLTGVARLLRSYSVAAMENQALWHERDISHSSVERVIFPDAFILVDYALDRMNQLVKGLQVDKIQMRKNIDLSQGQLFSSYVLLALIQKGLNREDAYQLVQSISHSLKPGESLKKKFQKSAEVGKYLSSRELETVFSEKQLKDHFKKLVAKSVRS